VKFNDSLKNAYLLFEQEPPESALPDAAMPQKDALPEAPPGPDLETKTDKLTPEGEVMLIRLLLKAFVLSPEPEDASEISKIQNVNANNAKEVLKKIIGLVRKYTNVDVDIPEV
jgi:hypothetical protein